MGHLTCCVRRESSFGVKDRYTLNADLRIILDELEYAAMGMEC